MYSAALAHSRRPTAPTPPADTRSSASAAADHGASMTNSSQAALTRTASSSEAIRAVAALAEVHKDFAHWPILAVHGAFLFGRQYARWESGGEFGTIPTRKALEEECGRLPDLKCVLDDLREVGEWAMEQA